MVPPASLAYNGLCCVMHPHRSQSDLRLLCLRAVWFWIATLLLNVQVTFVGWETLDLSDEFEQAAWASVVQCVAVLQAFSDQSSPEAARRAARQIRSHVTIGDSTGGHSRTRNHYKISFLVRACLLGQLLRNQSTSKPVMTHVITAVLPAVVRETFLRVVDECQHIQPDPATISRWRFLIDAALMLYSRRKVEEDGGGLSKARYLMADASSQHNREFEHIVVLEVDRSKLQELLLAYWDLVHLRRDSDAGNENIIAIEQDLMSAFTLYF